MQNIKTLIPATEIEYEWISLCNKFHKKVLNEIVSSNVTVV